MTIFKSSEYPGLRICNVDDSKVIDLICMDRSWSDNLNQTNTWRKHKRQITSHKDDEQQSRTKMTKSRKKKRNSCENHLFQ